MKGPVTIARRASKKAYDAKHRATPGWKAKQKAYAAKRKPTTVEDIAKQKAVRQASAAKQKAIRQASAAKRRPSAGLPHVHFLDIDVSEMEGKGFPFIGKKVALLSELHKSDKSPPPQSRKPRASSRSRKASSKPKAKTHEEEEEVEEPTFYSSDLPAIVDENEALPSSQGWGPASHSQQNASFDHDIFSLQNAMPNVLPHKDVAATVIKRKRAPRPNPAASPKQRRNELAEDVPDAKALLADPAFAFLKGL